MEPNPDGAEETAYYCPTDYRNAIPDSHTGNQVAPEDPAVCDNTEWFAKVESETSEAARADLFAAVNGVGLRLFE